MTEGSTAGRAAAKKRPTPTKRSRKSESTDDTTVLKLRWTLHELPSSQHKAGLAGLALCVAFLKRKPDRKGVCEIDAIDDQGLTFAVDRLGMQCLFDDVYDASMEEQERDKKLQKGKGDDKVDAPLKDTRVVLDPKTQKPKTVYVYDQVVPRGAFIDDLDRGTDGKKLWLKLWRDLVWQVLRAKPTTRGAYNARARHHPTTDGADAWDVLATRPQNTVRLPSTYAIGVQESSAEDVPFQDVERFRFLLHFWPFVAAIYVPITVDRKGERAFSGFALAVPDIVELEPFVDDWPIVARGRSGDASGYRPRDAVIDVAGEAGLDVLRRSLDVIVQKQGAARTKRSLAAVDVFYLEREGNNVPLRTVARIDPEQAMIDEYGRIRGAYWSPFFRRQRISNVLEGKAWWWGFGQLCAVTPKAMTIEHDSFQHDCKAAMTEVEMKQDVSESEQTLEHQIYRRVQSYVLGKTERKYELSWSKVQGKPAEEKEYREKKEKVGREAFLAVRSRTGADFVSYFTSTICSIPHHASEEKFVQVARALMDPKEIERVRSLTLLALSAVS